MNHIGLVGRLTKDPNLKTISDNRVQTSFMIAVNRNYRNNQGAVDADFIPCIAWGKLAERIVKHCGKGSLIGINGRLQSRSYTNKENVKVYTMDVLVDDIRFFILKNRDENYLHPTTKTSDLEDFVLPEKEEAIPIP